MSIRFDKLQIKSEKIGWKLSKISNGKYMFRLIEDASITEFSPTLNDVEYFINNKGNM